MMQGQNLIPITNNSWSASNSALRFGSFQPCNRSFAQPDPLLFRHSSQNADNSITKHATGIQILLSETPVPNPVGSQPLEMLECFKHAFTAETIQSPKQDYIKFSARCSGKHPLKRFSITPFATSQINVFKDDFIPLLEAKIP